MLTRTYTGRKVWISGHTGFKGAWLARWLVELGADVTGFALPPADGALFTQLGLSGRLRHETGDVRDPDAVAASLRRAQPDFVFHLAGQALVRRSHLIPLQTYQTNTMGTVHVLEALRTWSQPCAAVMITTDKCYDDRGSVSGYRETDVLGGSDPYSSSKSMAELAIEAYRASYFRDHPVRVASGRAGNVLGGGDWAEDRILPDCIRALRRGESIAVRNPAFVRPWQHVLEPLSGYLTLGAALAGADTAAAAGFASAFNFGPRPDSNRTVGEVVAEVTRHWHGEWRRVSEAAAPIESSRLVLAIDKARGVLGWSPVWNFAETIERTVAWYRRVATPADAEAMTAGQIADYTAAALAQHLAWTHA